MSLWSYFQGAATGSEEPSGADTVERLCHRLESSTLIDDRRDALRAIKSLSRKFKLEVGTQAMSLLSDVLERDRSDPELAGYALDTVVHVVSSDPEEENPQPELSNQFAEIFVKDCRNVHLVLECVDEQDSRVRVPSLKALTVLLESQTRATQEHILTFPQGCSRLIDVLTDHREYVRNLAILLLIHLTSGNANIQKIIVFDDAFPRLLDIIVAEGCADGGVIVEDCLRILLNLLRSNPSNQTLFRENSHIGQLPLFFTGTQELLDSEEPEGWSTQKVTNVLQMLAVVRVLVSPANPTQNTRQAQRVVLQCGLLKCLADILMASGVPAEVLTETVNCVAECIRGYDAGQRFLADVEAPATPPRPAIVVLLMSMVNERQPLALRLAVLYAFQSYLYRNPDGQASVVSTLLPSSAEASAVTAGQLLCAGLFSSDAHTAWLAAVAMFYAVHANSAQKEQLLRVQLATGLGSPPVSLLQHCATLLATNPGAKSKLGLVQLLGGWLTQAPLVTKAFLSNAANVNVAIAELQNADQTEEESLAKGLYAYLLGACILAGHHDLLAVVEKRIGLEQFVECLGRVSKSEVYVKALKSPQPPTRPSLDHEFSKLFKTVESEIVRALGADADAGQKGAGSLQQFAEHESVVTQYKDLIKEQDTKLREAAGQQQQLRKSVESLTRERAALQETIRGLRDQNLVLKAAKGLQQPASASCSSLPSALDQVGDADDAGELRRLRGELEAKEQELGCLREELRTVREASLAVNGADASVAADSGGNPYFADDYDQVKLENSQLRARATELEEQVARVDELEAVKNDLERRIKELTVIEVERDELRASCRDQKEPPEAADLRRRLADAEKERDAMKSENEDLLVLLSDQDSKIELLKTQIRELGGHVEEEEEDIDDAEFEDN